VKIMPYKLQKIVIRTLQDDDPDLSYLEQECMGEEGKARLAEYGSSWWQEGIRAEATVYHTEPGSEVATIHTITSGGIWGVESDSDRVYKEELAREELAELRGLCLDLNGVTPEAFAEAAAKAENVEGEEDKRSSRFIHVDL